MAGAGAQMGSELSGSRDFRSHSESLGVTPKSVLKTVLKRCFSRAHMLCRELHDSIDLCGTASLAALQVQSEKKIGEFF